MDTELIEPDIEKLDASIAKATEELRAVEGDAHPSTIRIIDAYISVVKTGGVVPKKLADTIEHEQSKLGDQSKIGAALEKLKNAKSRKDEQVKKFMKDRSKLGNAAQQVATPDQQ